MMFEVKGLEVEVEGKKILKGVDLKVGKGEVQVIMGPNGSGKSTLAYTIMGHPKYQVVKGDIRLKRESIRADSPNQRAEKGIFLAFQYPASISGVSVFNFLKQAYEILRCRRCREGESMDSCRKMSILEFRDKLTQSAGKLKVRSELLRRSVNEGFSGGEKKRLEILQLLALKPKLAILDEIDSGLDIDSLKVAAQGINQVRKENPEMAVILITHYQRILKFIKPDFVQIMAGGKIIKSGDYSLVSEIEKKGYTQYE